MARDGIIGQVWAGLEIVLAGIGVACTGVHTSFIQMFVSF